MCSLATMTYKYTHTAIDNNCVCAIFSCQTFYLFFFCNIYKQIMPGKSTTTRNVQKDYCGLLSRMLKKGRGQGLQSLQK